MIPWAGSSSLLWVRKINLTPVFDPCWSRGRRLLAEKENLPVSADSSKTGFEKPPENRVNATLRKVNSEWS